MLGNNDPAPAEPDDDEIVLVPKHQSEITLNIGKVEKMKPPTLPTPDVPGELEQADAFMASIGFLLYPGHDTSKLTSTRWYRPGTAALTSGETTSYHVTTDAGLFWCKQFKYLITAQIKAAEARGWREAFNKIFEMAPKQNFEHWSKKDIADWFVALGALERGDNHE